MAICVQAPNIHPLNALLPLAIPTSYYLFYCGGRSSHRILISLPLFGRMRCILKVVERMDICVQATNIHPLNILLPLAIPTSYYLSYCSGRSNHRILISLSLVGQMLCILKVVRAIAYCSKRACLTEIRQAHLLYSQRFIGVVVVANLAQPSQAKKLRLEHRQIWCSTSPLRHSTSPVIPAHATRDHHSTSRR